MCLRLLLVALVAPLLLVACSSATPSGQGPSGSLVASEAPSASAQPTPSPTPEVEGKQLPGVECCIGRPLEPGRYASPFFVPLLMSVEIGEGWRGYQNGNDGVAFFLQGRSVYQHASRWLGLFAVTPAVGEEFMDDLRRNEFLTVGPTEATSLAGLTGTRTDVAAKPNPRDQPSPDGVPGAIVIPSMRLISKITHGWVTESAEARLRFYLLDATSAYQILVYVEAPPTEFDAFATDVDEVLNTLHVPAQ